MPAEHTTPQQDRSAEILPTGPGTDLAETGSAALKIVEIIKNSGNDPKKWKIPDAYAWRAWETAGAYSSSRVHGHARTVLEELRLVCADTARSSVWSFVLLQPGKCGKKWKSHKTQKSEVK